MGQFMSETRIRQQVQRMLARRFLLRFHVSLILLWTFAVGLLTTKGLLWLGVGAMAVRYPLAVVVAYLGFVLGVRVWLWYVGIDVKSRGSDDWIDLPTNFPGSGSSSSGSGAPIRPGGGSFGGGGGSGDYSVHPSLQGELVPPVNTLGHLGEIGEAGAAEPLSLVEGAAGAAGEGLPLLLVVLIIGLLLAVLGGGIYVIADAPAMLAEAAFEALLAGGLIRAARRVDEPDWSAAVIRRTWLPAFLVLVSSLAFALAVHHYRPEVHSLMELIRGI